MLEAMKQQGNVWQLVLGDDWLTCVLRVFVVYNLMEAEYIYTYRFFAELLSCFRIPFHMIGNKWLWGQISLPFQPVNHSETAPELPSSGYYKVESAQFPCYFSHHLQEDYVDTLSSKLTMWGWGWVMVLVYQCQADKKKQWFSTNFGI